MHAYCYGAWCLIECVDDVRLTKAQLDGACSDSRFDQDFFVDLIFADVDAEGKSATADVDGKKFTRLLLRFAIHHSLFAVIAVGEPANTPKSEGVSLNEEDRQAYEDMLHRDETFWQDIEDRKTRLQKLREEQLKIKQAEAEAKAAEHEAKAKTAKAEAKAKTEAETEALKKEQVAPKSKSFSINDTDDYTVSKEKTVRKGSWSEEKDKELMSELESLTGGASTKAATDVDGADLDEKAVDAAKATNDMDDSYALSEEFNEMKNLEKELGLQSLSGDLASLSDGKIDPQLELLDAELEDIAGLSPKADDCTDDVMNFEADDFEELEEYLSGLSTK